MLEGYWQESLDVLHLFFDSLFRNTNHPFDLIVFDNGSCEQVRDYLCELGGKGKIQYLILSDYNLGKLGAMDFMFRVAPGKYVSFADSDVYFRPGWLDASLEVMKIFPEAGQVTALPTADKATDNCDSTYRGIERDPSIRTEKGGLIPERFVEAHRLSIGKSRDNYYEAIGERNEIRIKRDGLSTYASAQDFQFTTRRRIIEEVLPLEVTDDEEYHDPIYSPVFESRIDSLGYWRLSTVDYLVHHIGNTMPLSDSETSWVFEDVDAFKNSKTNWDSQKGSVLRRRLLHNRYSRWLLKKINALTYSLLYEE
jgi:glycosyltransferase involved in cell wall biosynthesis